MCVLWPVYQYSMSEMKVHDAIVEPYQGTNQYAAEY